MARCNSVQCRWWVFHNCDHGKCGGSGGALDGEDHAGTSRGRELLIPPSSIIMPSTSPILVRLLLWHSISGEETVLYISATYFRFLR